MRSRKRVARDVSALASPSDESLLARGLIGLLVEQACGVVCDAGARGLDQLARVETLWARGCRDGRALTRRQCVRLLLRRAEVVGNRGRRHVCGLWCRRK